jgi:hypothetical protein
MLGVCLVGKLTGVEIFSLSTDRRALCKLLGAFAFSLGRLAVVMEQDKKEMIVNFFLFGLKKKRSVAGAHFVSRGLPKN